MKKAGLLLVAIAVLMAGGPFVRGAAAATTCTETIYGPTPINGSVVVPSGSTCNLQGIRVKGSVEVRAGGRLNIGGTSEVLGSITSKSAGSDTTTDPLGNGQSFSVMVCNTKIDGNVTIQGSTDRVVVGGGPCGGNYIGGDVKLKGNTAGVELVGNAPQAESGACAIEEPKPPTSFGLATPCRIRGEVRVIENSGSIDPPFNGATESAAVGYNRIVKDLVCKDNANGVTDTASSSDTNIVGGTKVGQCAVL